MIAKALCLCYNKNMKEKSLLRIQPIYTILVHLFLVLCFTFFLFMPYLLHWEIDIENMWYWIYYICFTIFLLICVYLFLRSIEWGIIDKQGFTIKCVFGKINYLKWKEIIDIKIEKKETWSSRGSPVYANWIIIRISNVEQTKIGFNKKKHNSIWVTANKKNIQIINLFAKVKLK